jgi:hypothetical protein
MPFLGIYSSIALHATMVISVAFERMTYAHDLTFGGFAFGLGLEFLLALHTCHAVLPGAPVLLSCVT